MRLSTMTGIDMLGAAVCMAAFLSLGITPFGAAAFFAAVGFASSLAVNHRVYVSMAWPALWGASALSAWLFIIAIIRGVMA